MAPADLTRLASRGRRAAPPPAPVPAELTRAYLTASRGGTGNCAPTSRCQPRPCRAAAADQRSAGEATGARSTGSPSR